MDPFFVQLITVATLLVGNTLFGTLSLCITKLVSIVGSGEQEQARRHRCAAFLLFFGGGVFISDCFLVLLPQANEYLEIAHEHVHEEDDDGQTGHDHHSFPIPEFIVLCSFFAAYVLQELIYYILDKFGSPERKSSDARVQFCSCAKRHTECSRTYKAARPDHTLFSLDRKLLESGGVAFSTAENFNTYSAADPSISRSQQAPNARSDLLRSSIIAQTIPNYGTLTNVSEPPTDSQLPVLSPPVLLAGPGERNQAQETFTQYQNELIVGNMLTLLALMLQFLFFSFALALLTTVHPTWYYLLLACSQNFILTFSACSGFASCTVEHTYVAMNVALLAVISPVGLVVAMINSNFIERIPSTAKGLVAAIACGMLIYTTFYEILNKKSQGNVPRFLKFVAIISGAATMAALQYVTLSL